MSRMLLFSISTSLAEWRDLRILAMGLGRHDALVVVMHSHGQGLLGEFLADDVTIQFALDVDRLDQRHLGVGTAGFFLRFLVEDVFAKP